MKREKQHNGYLELDLSTKLSQLEGAFKFLDYINNDLDNVPRNKTEQQTIKTNLKRIKDVRIMMKALLSKHRLHGDFKVVDVRVNSHA